MGRIKLGRAATLASAAAVLGLAAIAVGAAVRKARPHKHDVKYVECPHYRDEADGKGSEEER